MADPGFPSFLLRSFALLAAEVPDSHAALRRCLQGARVRLTVDGETIALRFEAAAVQVIGESDAVTIEVAAGGETILALADGASTLARAVLDDRLYLRGTPAALLRFYDGLMAYLHGAVRAPSFIGLLDEYRAAQARRPSLREGAIWP